MSKPHYAVIRHDLDGKTEWSVKDTVLGYYGGPFYTEHDALKQARTLNGYNRKPRRKKEKA